MSNREHNAKGRKGARLATLPAERGKLHRVSLRLPEEAYNALVERAARDCTSMNVLLAKIVYKAMRLKS